MSPVNTGILFLQFSSVINPKLLSKIVSAAVQKAEKLLYIKVKGLPLSETKISTYNRIVNQIYHLSSRSAVDRFDTRLILTDFKDSLLSLNDSSTNKVQTSCLIDTVITVNQEKPFTEYILNKRNGMTNEVLQVDSHLSDFETPLNLEPQQKNFVDLPNTADEDRMYDHVVIGGTFDNLHSGHKMLISAAILRAKKSLTIGVTDSIMIKTKKLWELIEPCQTRIKKLEEFLMDVEPRIEYRVVPITDLYGPTKDDPALQVIKLTHIIQNVLC
jgi:phosphopantetheine adenylyltransferase/dephospho-CoA kinase